MTFFHKRLRYCRMQIYQFRIWSLISNVSCTVCAGLRRAIHIFKLLFTEETVWKQYYSKRIQHCKYFNLQIHGLVLKSDYNNCFIPLQRSRTIKPIDYKPLRSQFDHNSNCRNPLVDNLLRIYNPTHFRYSEATKSCCKALSVCRILCRNVHQLCFDRSHYLCNGCCKSYHKTSSIFLTSELVFTQSAHRSTSTSYSLRNCLTELE